MKFVINDESFDASPFAWPEGSTFRLMYEGDRNSDEYRLTSPVLNGDSIKLIIDVVTRNVEREMLRLDEIDFEELKVMVDYLGIGLSTDYIYPLFLTINDRKDRYFYEDDVSYDTAINGDNIFEDLVRVEENDIFEEVGENDIFEGLVRVEESDMKMRKPDYNIIGKGAFKSNKFLQHTNYNRCDEVLKKLSIIPNLFVAGDYALARFSKFTIPWLNIDIFAYGDDSLDHIKTATRICLAFGDWENNHTKCRYDPMPIRYENIISVPVFLEDNKWINFRFILCYFHSPLYVLNTLYVESERVGFDIVDPDTYYCDIRFIRAYETKSNTVDPNDLITWYDLSMSGGYIESLMIASNRGFDIACPGFDGDNIVIPSNILKKIMDMNRNCYDDLTGIQILIVSALSNRRVNTHYFDIYYVSSENKISHFIPLDVMNEGQRIFAFENDKGNIVTYIPMFPRIELTNIDEADVELYQRGTTFY